MADFWWSHWSEPVAPYAVLLRSFIDGRLDADEFELLYLRMYKFDPSDWPPELFDVLDTLFGDVDAYCSDDELRQDVGGLNAAELRQSARLAFSRLEQLAR